MTITHQILLNLSRGLGYKSPGSKRMRRSASLGAKYELNFTRVFAQGWSMSPRRRSVKKHKKKILAAMSFVLYYVMI